MFVWTPIEYLNIPSFLLPGQVALCRRALEAADGTPGLDSLNSEAAEQTLMEASQRLDRKLAIGLQCTTNQWFGLLSMHIVHFYTGGFTTHMS